MPSNCCIEGCLNTRKTPGVTLHVFPKNEDVREKFISAVNQENWTPRPSSTLCSAHFLETDIDRTSLSCVRIREGALPMIFPRQPASRRPLKRAHGDESLELEGILDSPGEQILCKKLKETKSLLNTYKKEVKNLKQAKRRLSKKVADLSNILADLRQKINIDEEACSILSSISQTSSCLIKRSYEKNQNERLKKVYEERLRAFSITLHFLSPKAYNYVRKHFDTALPHPRTLRRWYSSVNAQPGFSDEVLRALKEYCDSARTLPICALMFDCMSIRKNLEWDGKEFHGNINVGSTINDDSATLATEVLVFHLVFLNSSWKIPVGYFFVNGITGEQLSSLIKQCLCLLEDTGICVASLTCDGTACNISAANYLGCSIKPQKLVSHFTHPLSQKPVYFFLDVSHMLKLVRNTLGEYKTLIDLENRHIDWSYLNLLHDLQKNEGLHLANKLTKQHINYKKQKMKVKLAAQVLSSSIADSLEYLKLNKVEGFEECDGTINFLRIFDGLFDVLNSRSIHFKSGKLEKQALCPKNVQNVTLLLNKAKKYILGLQDNMGKSILQSRRKTGFLGFLVCIESALNMYQNFVALPNAPLQYIPFYKVSQDHLERLFGYIRGRGGNNNNPTCKQFTSTFKRILIHSELHENSSGNVALLDKYCMFRITNTESPESQINRFTSNWRSLTDEEKISISSDSEDPLLLSEDSLKSDIACDIVEYIAGFIVRNLSRRIICKECRNSLTGTDSSSSSLIAVKDKGGLIKPSNSVKKICQICELAVKSHLSKDCAPNNERIVQVMTIFVLKQCVGKNLFSKSTHHFCEQDVELSHFFLLIKSICVRYFNIRLHHYCKQYNSELHSEKIRNHLTKTVTFLGQ